jgi:lambda family phage portal protein
MNFTNPFKRNVIAETKTETKQKRHSNHRDHVRYAAAQKTDVASSLFNGGTLSPDESLRRDLENLRAASRKAGEDNGYMKRYFGQVQTHVVGETGFKFQSRVKFSDGSFDRKTNKAIEAAFKEWSKKGSCEISGKLSRAALEELIVKTVSQDGDVIIRHIYDSNNKYGYSIQVIESDYLDATLNTVLRNGNQIKMGVEQDGFGRPIAYHLLTNHPGESVWSYNDRKYMRIPADEITLAFPVWRPGQTRGVPWAHAALLDLHHINEYRGSAQVQARRASENMLIYERDPDQEVGEGYEDEGEILDEQGSFSTVVPEGYKARESTFNAPATGLPEFQKASLRAASSGMEANYNVIGNDAEGVSFSTLRQGVLEDRDHWKRKQRWMIEEVCEEIFNRWLSVSLLRDAIQGLSASNKTYLCQPYFQGRRWQWVDPLKDEQAAGEAKKNFNGDPIQMLNDKGLDLDETVESWHRYLDAMEPIMLRANKLNGVTDAPPTKNDKKAAK